MTYSGYSDESLGRNEAAALTEELISMQKKAESENSTLATSWLLQTQTRDETHHVEEAESTDEKKISRGMTNPSVSLVLSNVNYSTDREDNAFHYRPSSLTTPHLQTQTEKQNSFSALWLQNQEMPTNMKCYPHSPPDRDTNRAVIRGFINLPCFSKKKIFMVYICGRYQGTSAETKTFIYAMYAIK